MKLSIRDKQPPLLVTKPDHYRIYIIYTPDLLSGSYYHLDFDGTVDLVTIKDGNVTDLIRISHNGKAI